MTNSQVNGYKSIYFYNTSSGATPTETAQIFCGQSGGLNLCTTTAHQIRLSTSRDIAPTTLSIEIFGTGAKHVTISARLATTSSATIGGPLAVGGDLSVAGFYPVKLWVSFELRAGVVASAPAATFNILWNNGYTSVLTANVTRVNPFIYQFTFEKHPNGFIFIPSVVARTGSTSNHYYWATVKWESQASTTTTCSVWLRQNDSTVSLSDFFFHLIP